MAARSSETPEKSNLKLLSCDEVPPVEKFEAATPNVGIIVGSILGGFVAGLLFAAAGVFFLRRGRKGVERKYEAMHGEDAVSLRTVDTGGRTLESRMSGPFDSSTELEIFLAIPLYRQVRITNDGAASR